MDNNHVIYNKGESYIFLKDYKEIPHYRNSLNRLTKVTFGFDFEQWYQKGYWRDKYRPYSLLHNDEIVANISVNPIEYLVNGKVRKAVQIGTVMTDKAYRYRGLSKELMNIVLGEYENACELIYLYANDSVLEFYPKFGFEKSCEFVHSKQLTVSESKLTHRKLDMSNRKDVELITRLVEGSMPVSNYAMIDNPSLKMFYLTSYMAEDIYYFEEMDLAAVVTWENGNIYLNDLFCEREYDLSLILPSFARQLPCKVILGFTPKDHSTYTIEPLVEKDTTFFVKGNHFLRNGRFPVLSHA